MVQRAHLAEFVATVTGATARSLIETYCASLNDPSLSLADIVSRPKSAMEAKLAELGNAPPRTLDY